MPLLNLDFMPHKQSFQVQEQERESTAALNIKAFKPFMTSERTEAEREETWQKEIYSAYFHARREQAEGARAEITER